MKRYNNLYEQVCNFENLKRSFYEARKGKNNIKEVIVFSNRLNQNLIKLQKELMNKTYKMGEYRIFTLIEPKERLIMAQPFRDRVVQHSLCDYVLEPIFDRHLIHTNCANRHGFGMHYGLKKLKWQMQKIWRKNRDKKEIGYCLKCDISKYFYNIDHELLKNKIRKLIKCKETLWLIDLIIDSTDNPGLPIGNLTSQLFAIFYLSDLDHFIKEKLRIEHYVRYMDDFTLLHEDKEYLTYCKNEISKYIEKNHKLKLNQKTQIFPLRQGIEFLGFHTYITESGKVIRKIRKSSKQRIKRKLKLFQSKYAKGEMDLDRIKPVIASWQGHAKHGNCYNLSKKIFKKFKLMRRNENEKA